MVALAFSGGVGLGTALACWLGPTAGWRAVFSLVAAPALLAGTMLAVEQKSLWWAVNAVATTLGTLAVSASSSFATRALGALAILARPARGEND